MNSINKVTWRSPSNIAIVKYWGKSGIQIPMSPSVSFTLTDCYSETSIEWHKGSGDIKFFFHDEENNLFLKKIKTFFSNISKDYPFVNEFDFTIRSMNSFPHSAGIASSASSMSALALCLISIKERVTEKSLDFYKEASSLARLGSGSACRSVYGSLVVWGATEVKESSNYFGVELAEVHEVFKSYHDSIVIVDSGEKSVSSTAGHSLMNNHKYREIREQVALDNFNDTVTALKNGDVTKLGEVLEEEALSLHALMMTSNPSYILLRPESLSIIESVRQFREDTSIPVYFTLDAGPNIHLVYPERYLKEVRTFIEKELLLLTETQKVIHDRVGTGPVEVTND